MDEWPRLRTGGRSDVGITVWEYGSGAGGIIFCLDK